MSQARLRLATKLEDLENQHQPVSPSQFHQLSPAKYLEPERDKLPRTHYHVGQILYAKDVYKDYPSWKRWLALLVHIPLFRLLEKSLGLFPPTGRDAAGASVWNAHQGCFLTREEADRDAARYPHGYVVPNMPLGQSLTESVPEKSAIYFPHEKTASTDTHYEVDLASIQASMQEEVNKFEATVKAAKRAEIQ